ncbi:hypothetical protein N0V90_006822 [Kalmusia sp. IMI 367209]|nr:hypothetical protein N0V90_006822 [Kalmusia sp. IMI 367209]
MDSVKATAILAFVASANAAALPQIPAFSFPVTSAVSAGVGAGIGAGTGAGVGVAVPRPAVPVVAVPAAPVIPGIPSIPAVPAAAVLPGLPVTVPAPGAVTLPAPAPIGIRPVPVAIPNVSTVLVNLPVVSGVAAAIPPPVGVFPVPLSIPNFSTALPKLPVVDLPVSIPTSLPPVFNLTSLLKLPPVDLPVPISTGLPPIGLPLAGLPPPTGLPPLPPPGLPAPFGRPPPGLPPFPVPGSPKFPLVGSLPVVPPTGFPVPGLPHHPGLGPLHKGLGLGRPKHPPHGPPIPNPVEPSTEALAPVIKVGSAVLQALLYILDKGKTLIPGLSTPDLPVPDLLALNVSTIALPVANTTLPVPLRRRQILPGLLSPPSTPSTAPGLPLLGGLTSGLTSGLTGGSNPVSGVVGAVTNTVGSDLATVPVVGGVVAPVVSSVGGVAAPVVSTVGGVAAPVVSAVGGAVSGAVNTGGAASTVPNLGPYPIGNGVPGTDPVGGLSISIIATLLSLLKKDPLSLFGGLGVGSTGGLLKRDLPELADAFEIERRQLSATLPSMSTGVSGIGIGSLPLSGVQGVSPDIAFLVGSIAKNIAVPGGKGLGSITSGMLNILNGVVPNFLFQLPVVQDSVPTFGVLQLLASINPTKYSSLAGLTNFSALSQAAASISTSDLAFIRTLPVSTDPSNLITTITSFTDAILSLPGNVVNLKASVAVLALRNLGLSVPGL